MIRELCAYIEDQTSLVSGSTIVPFAWEDTNRLEGAGLATITQSPRINTTGLWDMKMTLVCRGATYSAAERIHAAIASAIIGTSHLNVTLPVVESGVEWMLCSARIAEGPAQVGRVDRELYYLQTTLDIIALRK